MKTLRTITAIFTPAIALCYLFSVNVIKLDDVRAPATLSQTKIELNLVQDESSTWYAGIAKTELNSKALAKR
jgi:hypothetical protein